MNIFTKFHKDSTIIVNFLLIAKFLSSPNNYESPSRNTVKNSNNDDPKNGKKKAVDLTLSDAIAIKPDPATLMEINFDGPFGAPATNIFRAEHAVLGN